LIPMVITHAQINRLYHQIETELSTFSGQLNKLEVAHYPDNERTQEIIQHLRGKVDIYQKQSCKIMAQWEDNPEEAINKLITYIHNPLVSEDLNFLEWLRSAQTENVPWSIIPLIKTLASHLIPDHKVLTRCAPDHNYQISWSRNPERAPNPFTILSLPRLHRTNVLWHTLLGHELFHPICVEFINKHNERVLASIGTQCAEQMPITEKEELFRKLQEQRVDEIARVTHLAWRRAMEELLSDMACVELFGPAAIMAMQAFCACSPLNIMPSPQNKFYPPARFRFEIVWQYSMKSEALSTIYSSCEKNGGIKEIVSCFKQEMADLEKLASESQGAVLVSKHPWAKIAYDEVSTLLKDASQFVRDKLYALPIRRWDDELVVKQIPLLLERLMAGIPPNEIVEQIDEDECKYITCPAEFAAILMAGWMYETYWQKTYITTGNKMPYLTMSRLLLKSCEDVSAIGQKEIKSVCSDKACNTESA